MLPKSLLVLSPHADDAELGCGGYIHRVIQAGGDVMVALATVGPTEFLHLKRIVSTEERLEEFYASMLVLGVKHTVVLSYGLDGKLNTFPQGEVVRELDKIQNEFKPSAVLIPLPSAHQDHKYCWDVGVATTRPSRAKHQPTLVGAYEYPLSSWGEGAGKSSFTGGMYIDITNVWDVKLKALGCYTTQMREQGELLSEGGVEALAKLRGVEAGFQYAELVHILRQRVGCN